MSVSTGHTAKIDLLYAIKSLLVLVIMFGFGNLPQFAGLTALGMQALGIFIALIYAWVCVDLIWPSFLAIYAVSLTGWIPLKDSFALAFGGDNFLIVMFVFIFAAYMAMSGLSTYIARWFISRKICMARPWVFTFMFFIAIALISSVTNIMAAMVLGWGVAKEICDICDFKLGHKYRLMLMFGVAWNACVGSWLFSFGGLNVVCFSFAPAVLGYGVNPVKYTMATGLTILVALGVYVFICRYILKPDVRSFYDKADYFAKYREQKMPTSALVALIALVTLIFCIFFASIGPKNWLIVQFLSKFSTGQMFLLALTILFAIRLKGKPLYDILEAFRVGCNWQILIMIAGSLPIAALMQSADSGVSTMLSGLIVRLFGGVGPFGFIILVVLFFGCLTQVAHNLVLILIVSPVLINVALQLGMNPFPILAAFTCAVNVAIATPGASAMGAMIFGNAEFTRKQALIYGWGFVFVAFALIIAVLIPLCMVLL